MNMVCSRNDFVKLLVNLLLFFSVGTNVGDISLWEVGSRERLVHKPFKVWDIQAASMPLQVLHVFCFS